MITAQEARLLTEERCKKAERVVERICQIIKASAQEGNDSILGNKELRNVAEIQITDRVIPLTDMQVKIVDKLRSLGFVVEPTGVKIYIGGGLGSMGEPEREDFEDTVKISW